MKPELLALTPFYAPAIAALERDYVLHKLWEAGDPQALQGKVARNVRGVVTTGLRGCTQEQIDGFPKLEIIGCFGTSHGTLPLAVAKERGIVVTNTPDWTVEAVADLAVGLLIAVMRRIGEADRFIRAGRWASGPFPMSADLRGKTCGIMGYGGIGSAVAMRVAAFGMQVCYHGPREKPAVPHPYFADLEAMARAADCLVVTCPETPATRKSINARILDALGPQGFLVNVARGGIADEKALIDALRNRRIAGAGLEAFWDEPHVPQDLLALENVVLAPHMGSSTREIREHRSATLLANLRAHFAGAPVPDRLA